MLRFDGKARAAFVAACLTLIVCRIGFTAAVNMLQVYLKKEPVPLRHELANVPRLLGPWQAVGTDETLDEAVIEALGTNEFLTRNYAHKDEPTLRVSAHVAYYTGMIDAVPHVPDRCLAAGGFEAETLPQNCELDLDRSQWTEDPIYLHPNGTSYSLLRFRNQFTGEPVTVRMPIGEFSLRTTEFSHPEQPGMRIFAGYFFVANGQSIARPEGVRKLAFDVSAKHAYYAKVEVTMYGGPEFNQDRFVETVNDFMNHFLPEVMWCLPDWAEVEPNPTSDPQA